MPPRTPCSVSQCLGRQMDLGSLDMSGSAGDPTSGPIRCACFLQLAAGDLPPDALLIRSFTGLKERLERDWHSVPCPLLGHIGDPLLPSRTH